MSEITGLDILEYKINQLRTLVENEGSKDKLIEAIDQLKLEIDIGGTVYALALHLLEAFHILELVFLDVHDLPLHFQGTGSPPDRFHGYLRLVHIGGELNGNSQQGDQAEQGQ